MPRKKKSAAVTSGESIDTTPVAVAEPAAASAAPANESIDPEMIDGKPAIHSQTAAPPKNWGPPYKAIYTNAAKGFELGENRRFKQRVFTFKERPDAETIDALKSAGFKYRAEEKAWTVPATPVTRELTDQLAQQFAGETASRDAGRSR
jgi:hypothetical protein